MRIVTYEDRPGDCIGVKLLLLSLDRWCPGLPVDLVFPSAPSHLTDWLARLPNVRLHADSSLKRSGYDVKPSMLLWALEEAAGEALWIDTDIIVTRDFRPLLSGIDKGNLVVTQEWFGAPYQGGDYRSRAWGLPAGRKLKDTTNTAVVRAADRHRPLLCAWDRFVARPDYVAAQQRSPAERPIHMQSDQEILSALLESEDFASIPIAYLRRGRHIAHCFQHQGYPAHQILGNLLTANRPYFVHGQGAKPWRPDDTYRTFLDLSPYTLCAADYVDQLDENVDWLAPKRKASSTIRRLTGSNPWISSLPLECAAELRNQRIAKTFVKKLLGKP